MSKALDLVRAEAERARAKYGEAFMAEQAYAAESGAFPPAGHPLADDRQMRLGWRTGAAVIEHVLEVAEGAPCALERCPSHANNET